MAAWLDAAALHKYRWMPISAGDMFPTESMVGSNRTSRWSHLEVFRGPEEAHATSTDLRTPLRGVGMERPVFTKNKLPFQHIWGPQKNFQQDQKMLLVASGRSGEAIYCGLQVQWLKYIDSELWDRGLPVFTNRFTLCFTLCFTKHIFKVTHHIPGS